MKKLKVGDKLHLPGIGLAKIVEIDDDDPYVVMKRGRRRFAFSRELLESTRRGEWKSDGKSAVRFVKWIAPTPDYPLWVGCFERVWVKSPWVVIGCDMGLLS